MAEWSTSTEAGRQLPEFPAPERRLLAAWFFNEILPGLPRPMLRKLTLLAVRYAGAPDVFA